ncbi:MAG: hypothetical protein ACK5MU_03555 [Candidatus Saccharimonadales bacterium]
MKRYRYANLLVLFMFFVAGFGTFAAKTMAYFDVPVQSTNDNPTVSYSVEDTTVDQISDVAKKDITALATTATIKQTAAKSTASSSSTTKKSSVCSGYYGYISIGGKNICLKSTSSTGGSLSYSFGYIFNSSTYNSYNQYIFAHNSANLFGGAV